jgi:hypothetical protein
MKGDACNPIVVCRKLGSQNWSRHPMFPFYSIKEIKGQINGDPLFFSGDSIPIFSVAKLSRGIPQITQLETRS